LRPFGKVPANTSRVVLGASPLALSLGFYSVAIPVFLPLEGVSVTNVGVLLTTWGLTTVVLSVPFAILSDRYGRKLLMLTGAVISLLIMVVPGLTSNFSLLEPSAVLGGVGESMYMSTWNAFLADTTSGESRAGAFSLSFVTFTVASGVGSLIPGLFPLLPLRQLEAHRILFILLGILGAGTPISVVKWASGVKLKTSPRNITPQIPGYYCQVFHCKRDDWTRGRANHSADTDFYLSSLQRN
jgi:MFS family permease